ncbi:hypothetical protein LOD99_11088 [Oopsacas minuta]|uniref:Uncharacterized protein n=1 Tax=Oopsacas minuta TaxID=111878 RepID=A0AAV7KAZ8_9METZ|nr:hypothetical protein LOD99_11088 [Oopsacas minuta]
MPYHRYKYTESDHPPIYPSSSPTLSPPRVKQQARARINEVSKEIDTLKLERWADAKTSVTQEKFAESLNMSPSSRASSPDRIQQEVHYAYLICL